MSTVMGAFDNYSWELDISINTWKIVMHFEIVNVMGSHVILRPRSSQYSQLFSEI
jgi:hypothetical protein